MSNRTLTVLALLLTGCSVPQCVHTKVAKLGTCDDGGKCSVVYSDGSYGEEYYPLVGKPVCVMPFNRRVLK